jgi:hypothetical protein
MAIRHLHKLSEIFTLHPNAKIGILWLPKAIPFVGFKQTKQLALKAIRTANPGNVTEPQTISNQKKTTKAAATAKWAERWHLLRLAGLAITRAYIWQYCAYMICVHWMPRTGVP